MTTLALLKSRCTTPRSCACASASASCWPSRRTSSTGSGAARQPLAQRLPLDQLHRDVRPARPPRRPRRSCRCSGGSASRRAALRAPAAPAPSRPGRLRRQHLQRDVPLEPRVARPPDLAHPACAETARGSRTGRASFPRRGPSNLPPRVGVTGGSWAPHGHTHFLRPVQTTPATSLVPVPKDWNGTFASTPLETALYLERSAVLRPLAALTPAATACLNKRVRNRDQESGGAERDRTVDLLNAIQALSQTELQPHSEGRER